MVCVPVTRKERELPPAALVKRLVHLFLPSLHGRRQDIATLSRPGGFLGNVSKCEQRCSRRQTHRRSHPTAGNPTRPQSYLISRRPRPKEAAPDSSRQDHLACIAHRTHDYVKDLKCCLEGGITTHRRSRPRGRGPHAQLIRDIAVLLQFQRVSDS